MNKIFKGLTIAILTLTLTSCFEIKEALNINKDGSGTYSMVMDFSASKNLFQMLVDMTENSNEANISGIDGNPLSGLDSAFSDLSDQLNTIKGISNAKGIRDEKDFKFGISLSFSDVEALNKALSQMDASGEVVTYRKYYTFSKGRIDKANLFNLRNLTDEIMPKDEVGSMEKEFQETLSMLYEEVNYQISIETDGKIRKFTNQEAVLSGDKSELVFSKKLKDIARGNIDLSNSIRFK
jgi:hypothetical protein